MTAFSRQHGYDRRSLRKRLRRWFVLVAVLIVGVMCITALFATDSVERFQASIVEQNELDGLVQVSLVNAVVTERAAIEEYIRVPSVANVLRFEDAEHAAIDTLARLRSFDEPDRQVLVEGVYAAHDSWSDDWVAEALRRRGLGLAVGTDFHLEGEALAARLDAAIAPLNGYILEREQLILSQTEETGRRGMALLIGIVVVIGLGAGLIGLTLFRTVSLPLERLVAAAAEARETGRARFDVGRPDEFGALASILQAQHEDLAARYDAARVEADRANLFSRLSERLSSTSDEVSLSDAGVAAIRHLIPYAAGSISLLNPSSNRLTVVAAWGVDQPAVGERLLGPPDGCPAVRRSVPHIVRNAGDPLLERCAILPVEPGTHQDCLPLLASGKVIGVLHLRCPREVEIDPAAPELARRVTEQLGLAVANARLSRAMERLAMTDSMTGLSNALTFDGRLAEMLRVASGSGRHVGVIFLDLDHFKQFNDTYGHAAGDEGLRTLASTLTAHLREADIVARYGGEEFVVAVAEAGLEATAAVAEKLRYAIEQAVVALVTGRYARITASLGVAATDAHGFDAAVLLRTADAALYGAKTSGRNRVLTAGAPEAATAPTQATRTASPPERRRARPPAPVIDRPH